jgi:hypothetical protein
MVACLLQLRTAISNQGFRCCFSRRVQAKQAAQAAERAAAKAAKGEAAAALEDDSNEETDPTKYYENRVCCRLSVCCDSNARIQSKGLGQACCYRAEQLGAAAARGNGHPAELQLCARSIVTICSATPGQRHCPRCL